MFGRVLCLRLFPTAQFGCCAAYAVIASRQVSAEARADFGLSTRSSSLGDEPVLARCVVQQKDLVVFKEPGVASPGNAQESRSVFDLHAVFMNQEALPAEIASFGRLEHATDDHGQDSAQHTPNRSMYTRPVPKNVNGDDAQSGVAGV